MLPRAVLSASAVAAAAGVNKSWVYRAIDIGVLSEPCFAADVIVLKVYRMVSQFVWPDKPRQRSVRHEVDTWQIAALNAARNAVTDQHTTAETALYVLANAVHVANTRLERARLEACDPAGDEAAPLDAQVALRIPIGRWIEELPSILAKTPQSAPRRGVTARRVRAQTG